MTDLQKKQIQEMHQMGWSYKRIATTLSLLEGTVKSYCLRAIRKGILPAPEAKPESTCKQCGKALVQVAKRKEKVFCCKACRQKWWNSHQYLVNQKSKALYHFSCPTCGKSFTVYGNAKRKYCSHECYISNRYYKEANDGQ